MCIEKGGDCTTIMNGYYVEMILCTLIGIIWYNIFKNVIKDLQTIEVSEWLVKNVRLPVTEKNKHVF
jgi:PAT family acetyl-CoA transporter-like MFS transporter 1